MSLILGMSDVYDSGGLASLIGSARNLSLEDRRELPVSGPASLHVRDCHHVPALAIRMRFCCKELDLCKAASLPHPLPSFQPKPDLQSIIKESRLVNSSAHYPPNHMR